MNTLFQNWLIISSQDQTDVKLPQYLGQPDKTTGARCGRDRKRTEVDTKCMQMLQSIGNSIHSSIKLDVDYLSRHDDGKLPKKVRIGDRRIVDGA